MKKTMFTCGIITAISLSLIGRNYASPRVPPLREQFGIAYEWGSVIVLDTGKAIIIEDPPEYPFGTPVKVVFKTLGTESEMDDVVLDIKEK